MLQVLKISRNVVNYNSWWIKLVLLASGIMLVGWSVSFMQPLSITCFIKFQLVASSNRDCTTDIFWWSNGFWFECVGFCSWFYIVGSGFWFECLGFCSWCSSFFIKVKYKLKRNSNGEEDEGILVISLHLKRKTNGS